MPHTPQGCAQEAMNQTRVRGETQSDEKGPDARRRGKRRPRRMPHTPQGVLKESTKQMGPPRRSAALRYPMAPVRQSDEKGPDARRRGKRRPRRMPHTPQGVLKESTKQMGPPRRSAALRYPMAPVRQSDEKGPDARRRGKRRPRRMPHTPQGVPKESTKQMGPPRRSAALRYPMAPVRQSDEKGPDARRRGKRRPRRMPHTPQGVLKESTKQMGPSRRSAQTKGQAIPPRPPT